MPDLLIFQLSSTNIKLVQRTVYKIINKKKLLATKIADVIGNIVLFPRLFFRKHEGIRPNNVNKILIIRTAYIGDVVMTVPILKAIKERFHQAKVSFLTSTSAAPILENNPYVDDIISYNPFWFYSAKKKNYFDFIRYLRKRNYDLVIEARGDIREFLFLVAPLKAKYKVSYDIGGGRYLLTHVVPYNKPMHKVEYHMNIARFLGCNVDDIEWGVYLTAEEKSSVKEIMRRKGIRQPFVAAHPGSRLPLKTFPGEKCSILYDNLIKTFGSSLVIFGTEQEEQMVEDIIRGMKCKPITLVGKLSLRQLAGFLSKAALFICSDSAPMHIAAAIKTPTVAIFGPSKSRETGPYGNNHRVVEKDLPCRFTCDENVCRHKTYNECMRTITPGDVFTAAKELMQQVQSVSYNR